MWQYCRPKVKSLNDVGRDPGVSVGCRLEMLGISNDRIAAVAEPCVLKDL